MTPPETDAETQSRSMRERMLAGEPYIADDPDLFRESRRARSLCHRINALEPDRSGEVEALFGELLGSIGAETHIRPPFWCDYGYQTHVGARTFVNYGLVCLDVAPVSIGDDVQIGPNVQLLTPTHPVEPGPRREKWEGSAPITIGDNVWLGGGVIVCPGVSIGENTVVGAGSVVVGDLPANVVAVGSPARVIRQLDA
jgi:maltose O-acetyltransferase